MSTETDRGSITESDGIRSLRERGIELVLFACAAASVLVTLGIIATLLFDALEFFGEVSVVEFYTATTWSPKLADAYGVLPLVSGTLLVTFISALIAIPIGVAAAVYLSEYASDSVRAVLKPALEVLAGIPTVVYGYFALVYITPWLKGLGLPLSAFNVLSASIMVGVMIIPMVSSLSEDAMNAVPDSLRQAGYGMGATKFEVSTGVVIPAAVSGIFSSFILALSRAIGETMIVTVAMGQRSRLFTPGKIAEGGLYQSGQTMTSAMVNIANSDLSGGTAQYRSMFAIGLTLFVITFAMNLLSNFVAARYREEYE
jgi:phosphate transport system permease protein